MNARPAPVGARLLAPIVVIFLVFGLLASRAVRVEIGQAEATFPIIAFELAGSGEEAETILDEVTGKLAGSGAHADVVRDTVEAAVRRSLWWDFGFIVGYSLLILTLGRLLARRWLSGRPARLARIVAWTGPAAGLLDVVENVGLFRVLADTTRDTWACLATAASWAKWILVIGAVLFLAGALIASGVRVATARVRHSRAQT